VASKAIDVTSDTSAVALDTSAVALDTSAVALDASAVAFDTSSRYFCQGFRRFDASASPLSWTLSQRVEAVSCSDSGCA